MDTKAYFLIFNQYDKSQINNSQRKGFKKWQTQNQSSCLPQIRNPLHCNPIYCR